MHVFISYFVFGRQVNSDRHLYKEYMKRAESEAVAKLQVRKQKNNVFWEHFLCFCFVLFLAKR